MDSQKAEWIEIDGAKYSEAIKQNSEDRSVFIEMSVSPYDVPHHVRGDFDGKKNRFVIEFKYIDDEPSKEVRMRQHVIANVGRRSGRVYALYIDVHALGANAVALKMTNENEDGVRRDAAEALNSMKSDLAARRITSRTAPKNYSIAERVLGDYWTNIAKPAVCHG